MTESEILENNRLIKSFMGKDDEHRFLFDQLNTKALYHLSWDWLMPVVEKIEAIPHSSIRVQISGYLCDIIQTKRNPSKKENGGFEDILLISNKHNDKRILVWQSVVEFIKWYNENKKD